MHPRHRQRLNADRLVRDDHLNRLKCPDVPHSDVAQVVDRNHVRRVFDEFTLEDLSAVAVHAPHERSWGVRLY